MFSRLLMYALPLVTLMGGGLGASIYMTGALGPNYEKLWREEDSEVNLVCGLSNKKWICNLFISFVTLMENTMFSSLDSRTHLGGAQTLETDSLIKGVLIDSPEILKAGDQSQFYITDKDTSNVWFMFGASGTWWDDLMIKGEKRQNLIRPTVSYGKDYGKTLKGQLVKSSSAQWKVRYLK